MRLRQLLELANRDELGLIKSLLDKVTGSTLETAAGQIPKPTVPDVDFDDPTESGTNVYRGGYDNEPNAYTPSEQDESGTTTPEFLVTIQYLQQKVDSVVWAEIQQKSLVEVKTLSTNYCCT